MTKTEFDTLSSAEIVKVLGKRFAQYRKQCKMTQKEVSEQSGLSVFTISGFENGSLTGISLSSFVRLIRAIGEVEQIDKLLQELPPSPEKLYFEMIKEGRKK